MKTELQKTQTTICEALGLNPDLIYRLTVDMGVRYCRFTAEGYAIGSDGKKFAIRDGNDSKAATFALTGIVDGGLNAGESAVTLTVIGRDRATFESIPAALEALAKAGDQVREAVGIKGGNTPGEGVRHEPWPVEGTPR